MKTLTVACLAFALLGSAQAITLGQVDTFEDGTVQGWIGGGGSNPPTNIATGGPRGVDDNYLRVFAGVGGAQHLATYNGQQGHWTGNWTAAGVKVVEVHVRNQGPDAVELRGVWFGQFGSRYTSTIAVGEKSRSHVGKETLRRSSAPKHTRKSWATSKGS